MDEMPSASMQLEWRFFLSALAVAVALAWIGRGLLKRAKVFYSVRGAPGRWLMVKPMTVLWADVVPVRRWLNLSPGSFWQSKADFFHEHNSSVIVYRGLFPSPSVACLVADAEGAKAVLRQTKDFCKPVEDYVVLRFMGANVVASEHDQWRRHRRLTAGTFTEKNNELVWNESQRILRGFFDLLERDEGSEGEAVLWSSNAFCSRLTLMILSAAAFGKPYEWGEQGEGDELAGKLQRAYAGTLVKLVTPDWAFKWLPIKRLKQVQADYADLHATFRAMIDQRKAENQKGIERNDLFSSLVEGNESCALDTSELIGNLNALWLAGHETSAHSLAFLLTLLVLYPEHQDRIHKESQAAFEAGQPKYSDFSKLPYTMACIQECLRMYPPVSFLPRVAQRDVSIPSQTMPTRDGEEPVKSQVFVPRGARVGVLLSALGSNPTYWPDPFRYDPTRFIDTEDYKWNRDAWAPFAGGARQCIGQRFALVEMVSIVATILLRYTLEVPPDQLDFYSLRAGESERERRERIFRVGTGLTLTPRVALPLLFRPRSTE